MNAIVWRTVCSAAALAFTACGGHLDSAGGTPSTSGAGSTPDGGSPHAGREAVGGEGGASPISSAAGAVGGGEAGSGGEADRKEFPEETFPLSRADVGRIAGTSFSIRAERGGPTCDDQGSGSAQPSLDGLQLAFVAGVAGVVDVIASTRGPWLNIQRSQLLRTRSGYVVDPPPPTVGCWAYHFEDSYRPAWPTPKRLALDFAGKDEHGRVTSMSVSADFDSEDGPKTLTTTGARDVSAPSIEQQEPWVYDSFDKSYSFDDQLPSWRLPRHFDFTEALLPNWTVALENDAGDHFDVARSNGVELALGFDVVQFFPPGFHWVVTGRDFAGNALEAPPAYQSDLPALDSGSFESEANWPECNPSAAPQVETCVAASAPAHDDLPALAGTRSLYIGNGNVTLRIARTSGATKLIYRTRLISDSQITFSVHNRLQALDAGSSASVNQQSVTWQLDPNLSNAKSRVSLPQDVSVKLPPGYTDVLLSVDSSSAIWLDSVHTE